MNNILYCVMLIGMFIIVLYSISDEENNDQDN